MSPRKVIKTVPQKKEVAVLAGARTKLKGALLLRKQLRAVRDYAEAVIGEGPPLLMLAQNLQVQTTNESFCRCFKIRSIETVGRFVHQLGNGQWDIPELRKLLQEVLPRTSSLKDFKVSHALEGIGRRTMLLRGWQLDHLQRIVLFVQDITEQLTSQSALQASEIRYRRLFESAREGILMLDPHTRKITNANPFMLELLGYRHDELLNKELWEISLLKDERASRSAFRELRRTHFIRYEDLPLQNKAGERREAEFVSNLYDEDGRQLIQCNIRDITRRKQAAESPRASEKRFQAIFVQATAGIAQTDSEGRYTLVNKYYCDITGRTVKDLMELRIQDVAHPDDRQRNIDLLKKLKTQGGGFVIENRCLRPNGEVIWVRSSVSRVDDASGGHYFLAVTVDITEHKQVEQALLRARDEMGRHAIHLEQLVHERTGELRQTIKELEGFSYSVSHDMRAPLRAMQSFSQFLVEEYGSKLDEQGVHYLNQIMRSAVRLDRLIQDVLSYTKIIHGKLPMERVDLDRLVRDIVETFPNGRPIKPEIRIRGTLPPVMGNEALLAQCVSHLLSNGAKFVSPGTTPRLEIWAEAIEGDLVRVWFKDNGIGVAEENHERIFRLFERIHPGAEYEGTGIGLTIVRKAVDRMGAQIGFESKLGQGSNFWIQLKTA